MTLKKITISNIDRYLWPWEPNWRSPVKVKPIFKTVISSNKRFQEQRRSILDKPQREMSCSFQLRRREQQKFWNDIRKTRQEYLAIPIYPEAIIPSAIVGDRIDTEKTDLDYLMYLQFFQGYLFGLDWKNELYEIGSIYSIDSNSRLYMDSAWSESFSVDTTQFFPIFFGEIVNKPEPKQITPEIIDVDMNFREVVLP